jgi:hypothetical protein
VLLVVHAERRKFFVQVVPGFDPREVRVDDLRGEAVEVSLGRDALDGDEPLDVRRLGPARGADLIGLLDEVWVCS